MAKTNSSIEFEDQNKKETEFYYVISTLRVIIQECKLVLSFLIDTYNIYTFEGKRNSALVMAITTSS